MFKKNQNRGHDSGFTLIELLVTTGLTLILVGGALASYNSFNTRQGHIQSARNVMAAVERAKTRSAVGEKPASCTTLDGYRVRAAINTATYTVSIRCDGNSTDLEPQQFFLPSGYLFRTAFDVVFPPLPRNVSSVDQNVDIAKPTDTDVYRFVIRANGAIEDQGLVTP